MASGERKVISLKNVVDQCATSATGHGEFTVGLSAEDTICMISKDGDEENKICVPLFLVTVWPTSGMTITPTNKDLKCFVNNNVIISETNLLPGSVIEIGDKVMEFFDGPVPRVRRHLPPTPGVHVLPAAPPKPNRNTEPACTSPPVQPLKLVDSSYDMYKDWCVLQSPSLEEELVSQLKTSEEIANLAASYLNKQIHMHTDTRMTSFLMDQVFKVLQDVACHRKDILVAFLKEVAREIKNHEVAGGGNGRPLHDAIICLLVELLKQFLDPVSQVILVLQLLRSLSHIQYNLATLIKVHAPAAILGTMSAYLSQAEVQLNSLDILAKIATYIPLPQEKIPLRETGIELVLRAVRHHSSNLLIVQASCRTFSNLATMLYETATQIIDSGNQINPDLGISLKNLTFLLEHIYQNCMAVVQDAIRQFSDDLTIKTEGRKFLYVIARLPQLQQRKERWFETLQEQEISILSSSPSTLTDSEENATLSSDPDTLLDSEDNSILPSGTLTEDDENSVPCSVPGEDVEEPTEGILKKSRSFENLRQPERRVFFDDDHAPGVYDSSSSLDDSSTEFSPDASEAVSAGNMMHDGCTEFSVGLDIPVCSEGGPVCSERGKEISQNEEENSATHGVEMSGGITENSQAVQIEVDDVLDGVDKSGRQYDEVDIVHALVNNRQAIPEISEQSHCSDSGANSMNIDESDLKQKSCCEVSKTMIMDDSESFSRAISCEVSETVADTSDMFNFTRVSEVETVSGHLVFVNSLDSFEDTMDYTAADVNFLSRLTKAQIVCRVCSLALQDDDSHAYSIIDQPLKDVLAKERLSRLLQQFVIKQYKPELTLMDLDPNTAISLIDAVRYRSQVAPEVVQKTLIGVAKQLSDSLRPCHLHLALAFFNIVLQDAALETVVSDPNFCAECKLHLENAAGTLADRCDIDIIIAKLKKMMGFIGCSH